MFKFKDIWSVSRLVNINAFRSLLRTNFIAEGQTMRRRRKSPTGIATRPVPNKSLSIPVLVSFISTNQRKHYTYTLSTHETKTRRKNFPAWHRYPIVYRLRTLINVWLNNQETAHETCSTIHTIELVMTVPGSNCIRTGQLDYWANMNPSKIWLPFSQVEMLVQWLFVGHVNFKSTSHIIICNVLFCENNIIMSPNMRIHLVSLLRKPDMLICIDGLY